MNKTDRIGLAVLLIIVMLTLFAFGIFMQFTKYEILSYIFLFIGLGLFGIILGLGFASLEYLDLEEVKNE